MSRWLRIRIVLDRVIAAVVLVVVSPLIAALACLIRGTSSGSGIVALIRIGRYGRSFRMWKLRTMRATAPDGSADGAAITSSDDSRVTPIGTYLRRWRLDELPQLWNVIRGEMALLGPRPEVAEYVDLADDRWREVLAAPPGIAGPTQLAVADWEAAVLLTQAADGIYRNEILPVKLAIDAWYVGEASPIADAELALSLVQRFVMGRGQTLIHDRIARAVPSTLAVPMSRSR